MRSLIAIVNCHGREAYQQCIRDTWLPFMKGADVRFFLGPSSREPKADEVFVECDDSYQGLPSKVRAIVRWALEHDYDYVLKLDDDVVLRPDQFLGTGYENHDFTGHRNDVRKYPIPFGFAYWLSSKAMKLVADAPLPNNNNDEAWVTERLSSQNISLHHEPRFVMYTGVREDFVPPKARPLRVPQRPRPMLVENLDPSLVVAWCMYFTWTGHRNTPEERIISEMRKVFQTYVRSS